MARMNEIIPSGTQVIRINKDNFPVCKVGDVGVVATPDEDTLMMFGSLCFHENYVLVDFGNGAAPNLLRHLQAMN